VIRVGFGSQDHLQALRDLWLSHDHDGIGTLLGYPSCCRGFFVNAWRADNRIDTTWPMALGTSGRDSETQVVSVSGPDTTNVLWRWVDVRAVPHLPCSFECAPSASLGEDMLSLGTQMGFVDEVGWCRDILSWPVEWSSLHGIAEIRTPVLRISTNTDTVDTKCVVRRPGTAYPEEGATGLTFPYQMRPIPIGRSRAYRQGLDSPVQALRIQPAWYHTDNGFSSRWAMDLAHRRILPVAGQALVAAGPAAVADLGCGNGALLRLLREEAEPALRPFGIDVEVERIAHARRLFPDHANNFVIGDLFKDQAMWPDGRRYRLVLLGVRRLEEANPQTVESLLGKVSEHADLILLYAYHQLTESGILGLLQSLQLDAWGRPSPNAALVATKSL
jgi:hypothetical protein